VERWAGARAVQVDEPWLPRVRQSGLREVLAVLVAPDADLGAGLLRRAVVPNEAGCPAEPPAPLPARDSLLHGAAAVGAVGRQMEPQMKPKAPLLRVGTRATRRRAVPNRQACTSSTVHRRLRGAREHPQRAERPGCAAAPLEADGPLPHTELQRAAAGSGLLGAHRSRRPCAGLRRGGGDAARPRARRGARLQRGARGLPRRGSSPPPSSPQTGACTSGGTTAVGRGGSATAPAPPRRPLLGSLTRVRRMFTVQHSLRNRPPKRRLCGGRFRSMSVQ